MDRSLEKTGESAIGHLLPVSPLVEKPEEGTVEQANGLMSPVHPCPKPMAEFGMICLFIVMTGTENN